MTEREFGTGVRRRGGRRLALTGLLLAGTALVLVPQPRAAGTLDLVPNGPSDWYHASGVSNDGRFVAGVGVDEETGETRSFHYGSSGVIDIGDTGHEHTVAAAISGNGAAVVGEAGGPGFTRRAFRWTEAAGVIDLGTLRPDQTGSSYAAGVSFDGSRVAGVSANPDFAQVAFIWIEGATTGVVGNEQMFELHQATDGWTGLATGISDDGNFVIGTERLIDNGFFTHALRWDVRNIESSSNAPVITLGSLGGVQSEAHDVSADGSMIVGTSTNNEGNYRAFLWTEGGVDGVAGNEQMRDLGTLGGNWSHGIAISSNGDYVVGKSAGADGMQHAYRWEDVTGMVSVADWLAAHNVEVNAERLTDATGVSDDGNVVVGQLEHENRLRAYIARVVPNEPGGSGIMDVAEYQGTLYSAAGIANAGEFLTWLPMNGAHHRPLMMAPKLSGDMCAWATGDLAHHGASETGLGLAEAGACVDLAGGALRLGGAVGTSGSWQTLALGGSSRLSGQYVLSEIDWQPDGTPLLLSVTGMLGGWGAHIDRAYSNGAAMAVSSGDTNVSGGVVRVRADWLEAAVFGNTTINPWASASLGVLHVDGYTESGGPFPAVFQAQGLAHADIRFGVTAVTELSTQTRLSTTFEVAHRTGTAVAATGTVPGLFDFALGGGSQGQTWARVGAELDHAVSEDLAFSTSLHLASNGRDPTIAGSVGIRATF